MWIIRVGKKLNRFNKDRKKKKAGMYLSPVRRIEKVAPLKSRKLVAMTFDDGPMSSPPSHGKHGELGLTEVLLNALDKYDAKGTFDVIGTTEHSYPDVSGKINTASWGGVKYDHYPNIDEDKKAGVKNLPEITNKILDGGHEITNHSYNHILFGTKKMIYGKREHYKNVDEVIKDAIKLDDLLGTDHNYKMKLARPPHYIDNISKKFDAYFVYQLMGYNYMAASFDGGGWLPTSGDYKKDVDKMSSPIINKLKENSDFFNGQIIFQKDGYNMSVETPVADALPIQLEALTKADYKVVTVSEMIKEMPFEDIYEDKEYFDAVKRLDQSGYVIGYKNNTFQPDRVATLEELIVMTSSPELFKLKGFINHQFGKIDYNTFDFNKLKYISPYDLAIENAYEFGCLKEKITKKELSEPLTIKRLTEYFSNCAYEFDFINSSIKSGKIKRWELVLILDKVLN